MQNYQLKIQANKRPETLERILRVIRHRGFEVVTLNVGSGDHTIEFDVTVKSERAVELLKNQLVKLIDVNSVN